MNRRQFLAGSMPAYVHPRHPIVFFRWLFRKVFYSYNLIQLQRYPGILLETLKIKLPRLILLKICQQEQLTNNPAIIYLLRVNNRNTRTRCEICSKLIIKTPEGCHWGRSDVFIVNFEHISHLVLVFLLLTLNM